MAPDIEKQVWTNKANIENLAKTLEDFQNDVKENISHISSCVVNLTNHFSKKPSWLIAAILVILTNLLTGLILYMATH